jgi:hypothetical protein
MMTPVKLPEQGLFLRYLVCRGLNNKIKRIKNLGIFLLSLKSQNFTKQNETHNT